MNRQARLRRVAPGADPDLLDYLASRPAAEVAAIAALARQARRDAVEGQAARRRQRKADNRKYGNYDEHQLVRRNVGVLGAAGSRAGASLDALAGLVKARDAIDDLITAAVPQLRAGSGGAKGYSDPEIAKVLGVTRQAVAWRYGAPRLRLAAREDPAQGMQTGLRPDGAA